MMNETSIDPDETAVVVQGAADTATKDDSSWQNADFLSLEAGLEEDAAVIDDADVDANIDDRSDSKEVSSEGKSSSGMRQNNLWRSDLPPWMEHPNDYRRQHPLVALHNEIVSFCHLMEPMPSEIRQRSQIIDKVKDLVKRTFVDTPSVEVQVFGSFATGLLLPTSDIDLVIQSTDTGTNEKSASGGKNGDSRETSDDMNMSSSSEGNDNDGIRPNTNGKGAKNLDEEEDWNKSTATPLQRLAAALRSEWISELSYLELIENTRIPLGMDFYCVL